MKIVSINTEFSDSLFSVSLNIDDIVDKEIIIRLYDMLHSNECSGLRINVTNRKGGYEVINVYVDGEQSFRKEHVDIINNFLSTIKNEKEEAEKAEKNKRDTLLKQLSVNTGLPLDMTQNLII